MSYTPIPILMYHSIQSEPKNAKYRGLSVPKMLFKVQMYLLKFLGYKGLSMSKLQPYLYGEKKGKVFGITFDDGYLNNFTNALPVLTKLKFSATCYIVAGNIGGTNHWDEDKGISKKYMMSKKNILDWIKNGMEIGSHSMHHIKLSNCTEESLVSEIKNSKHFLEKEFNVIVNHFCPPYGDSNLHINKLIKKYGYQTSVLVKRGRVPIKCDPFSLPRVLVNNRTYPHLLLLKFLTKYEDRKSK